MLVWATLVMAGLALIGLGVFFVLVGLDRADKLGSVIGAFVGLVGLLLAGYATVRSSRGWARASAEQNGKAGQSVTGSAVGGDVTQIRAVRGSVRIGPAGPARPAGRAVPGMRAQATDGGQAVTNSSSSGGIRQVDGVDGDVDVER